MRVTYELGKIGVEEERADEQIPRTARRKEDDPGTRNRNIPWGNSNDLVLN